MFERIQHLSTPAKVAGVVGVLGSATAIGALSGRATQQRLHKYWFGDDDQPEAFGSLHTAPVPVYTEDGVRLHTEVVTPEDFEPTRDVTLVYSHGYGLNLDSWHFQRRGLGELGRQVFWDQRSHGRSGRADPASHTIDQLGRDLARVVEATTDGGPVVLVGHSMGGMTVLSMAAQFPELFGHQIRGVALLGTSSGDLDTLTFGFPQQLAAVQQRVDASKVANAATYVPRLVDRTRTLVNNDTTSLLTKQFSFGHRVPLSMVRFVTEMLAYTPIEVYASFLPTLQRHNKKDALPVLQKVRSLVMVGEADVMTPPSHSLRIIEQLPEATFIELAKTGHVLMLERATEVTAAVRNLGGAVIREIRGSDT